MSPFAISPMVRRPLVVIPTYDEAQNLPIVVPLLLAAVPWCDVLVVDDASPDGTGQIADCLARDDPRVHVMHRAAKEGVGSAYRAGFKWGLDQDFDTIVQMDADLSHPPEQVPDLLARLGSAALVIGSRHVDGSGTDDCSTVRLRLSRLANRCVGVALGLRVADVTSRFRAWDGQALRSIDAVSSTTNGYAFQVDTTVRATEVGLEIAEVPIEVRDRSNGRSKMGVRVVAEAFWWVASQAVRVRLHADDEVPLVPPSMSAADEQLA